MMDRTGDWCFEGGCTYMVDTGGTDESDLDTTELEAMYMEPCIGSYD